MSLLPVEDQFVAAMLADPTVAGYLGSAPTARLYDTQLPQNTLTAGNGAAAVYHRISTNPLYTHGAPDNSNVFQPNQANSGRTRFQVTVWADTSSVRPANAARQIAQALINAIRSFNAWNPAIQPGPCQVLNQRGGVEPQTQPPIPSQMFDVIIPYADNT